MASISISLFGSVRFFNSNAPINTITSPKIHALVAFLALTADQSHDRAEIAELIWPERPPGVARQNLRQALTRLNRGLGTELLCVTRQTMQFRSEASYVDVRHFMDLIETCHTHAHLDLGQCRRCCQKLAEAVALYRDDFLATLVVESPPFEQWMRTRRESLGQQTKHAIRTLVQHHAGRGEYDDALRFASRRTEIDPLDEGGHLQLMETLARAGRMEDALAQYERCRQLFRDELDVEPAPETTALWEELRGTEAAQWREEEVVQRQSGDGSLRNFPVQHTPFVGREGELVALRELLHNPVCHLLTLLGHGGVGKTRLALQTAQAAASEFGDGAAFVELAAIVQQEHVPAAIANVLGLTFSKGVESHAEQWTELLSFLQGKSFLLLLDNAEHLISDEAESGSGLCSMVRDLVETAPESKILITSRQPLHLRAEWIFDVEGLNYPAMNERSSDNPIVDSDFALEQFGSMQLFVQSVQRIKRSFTPGSEDLLAVASISQLVEGTPLALELAASWGREFSCREIQRRLEAGLDCLSTTMHDVPPRHRSIRAVFESTWSQLNSAQRQVCASLSLLRGPFSTAAAFAVAQAERNILTDLLDRSLLRATAAFAGAERFEMHELLRQYAWEKLAADAALLAKIEKRHAAYFSGFVAAQYKSMEGPGLAAAVQTVHEQIANVRAAWRSSMVNREVAAIQRSASGLLFYYTMTNQTEEAITVFSDGVKMLRTLAQPDADCALAELLVRRSRAYYKLALYPQAVDDAREGQLLATECGAGRVAMQAALYGGISLINLGDHEAAHQQLSEALALAQQAKSPKQESDSLRALGILADQRGELDTARKYYEQSLVIGRSLDDPRGISACLGNLGAICRQQGDFERAKDYLAESLAVHVQIGDRSSKGRTLSMLGDLATDLEEYDLAEVYFHQAFEILTEIRQHHYAADALVGLGECYARQGSIERATPLWEKALTQYEEAGEQNQIEQVSGYLEAGFSKQETGLLKR